MYRISVVIPSYNREKTLRKAIESVLKQRGQEEKYSIGEILVMDDGSTDHTENLIRELDCSLVRYQRAEENRGAAHARNTGVKLAKEAWIAFQDSDDIWYPDKLQKQVNYLEEHPTCFCVSHPIKVFFPEGRAIQTEDMPGGDPLGVLASSNLVGTPSILVNREIFLSMGGFDEELRALEDWEFALRYAGQREIGFLSEPLLRADMSENGVSSNAANYYDARCRMIVKNREILEKNGCMEAAMRSVLEHAQRNQLLEQVGKMMALYLGGGMV